MLETIAKQPSVPRDACLETLGRWRHLLRSASGGISRHHVSPAWSASCSWSRTSSAQTPRSDSTSGPGSEWKDATTYAAVAPLVEVKTTLSHVERRTTIHGIDQLEIPDDGTLHVVLTRLEPVAGGPLNVVDLAEDIIALGASAAGVYDRMARSGSPAASADDHRAVTFALREQLWFAVDEQFPRVSSADSFVDGALPHGVKDMTYEIDLAGVGELDPAAAQGTIVTLAQSVIE